jgi:ribonuclease HII
MEGASAKVTVVGIDEAGYGPLLGPLVVSAVVFRAPADVVDADWWALAREAIALKPKSHEPRLVVTDSKELSRRDEGLRLLERAALTFLSVPDGRGNDRRYPPTFAGLLGQLNQTVLGDLKIYPWYANADHPLPIANGAADILTQRSAVGGALRRAGIEFVAAHVEALPEGHFNRLVGATRNKAVVLLGQTIRLIQRSAETTAGSNMTVFVDKQGARNAYGRPLMTSFDDAHLEILEEGHTRSSYRLVRRPGPWTVRFLQNGEKQHLPIALASIFSKYVRELFMHAFNRYWAEHVPGVARTAGYYTDAKRFIREIEPAARRLQIDRHLLVRAR